MLHPTRTRFRCSGTTERLVIASLASDWRRCLARRRFSRTSCRRSRSGAAKLEVGIRIATEPELLLHDDIDGVDNPGDIAEQSQKNVEPKVKADSDLQEYAERGKQNG